MTALEAYRGLLRFYPRDYRSSFEREMLNAFEQMRQEHRGQGTPTYAGFVIAELAGLAFRCVCEWIAKATTDATVRGRSLPDLRRMRPAGIPREVWFAAAARSGPVPDEVIEAKYSITG